MSLWAKFDTGLRAEDLDAFALQDSEMHRIHGTRIERDTPGGKPVLKAVSLNARDSSRIEFPDGKLVVNGIYDFDDFPMVVGVTKFNERSLQADTSDFPSLSVLKASPLFEIERLFNVSRGNLHLVLEGLGADAVYYPTNLTKANTQIFTDFSTRYAAAVSGSKIGKPVMEMDFAARRAAGRTDAHLMQKLYGGKLYEALKADVTG